MVPSTQTIEALDIARDLEGAFSIACDLVNEELSGSTDLCAVENVADSCPTLSRVTMAVDTSAHELDGDLASFHLSVLNGPSFRVLVIREDH